MQIELKHIKGNALEQEFSCLASEFSKLNDLAGTDGVRFLDPIRFHLRFQRSGRLVEVDGSFEAILEMSCARCLEVYTRPLSEGFTLTFTPQSDEDSPEERQLESDDLGLVSYQEERLDLTEPLQDQLLVAVPIRALCHDACRGLCPICGADLNQNPCGCEKKPFNNKFSVLSQIKPKQ